MDFSTLKDRLTTDRRSAWMKLVIGASVSGPVPVWLAQIVVGPRPDGWETRRWDYPECSFVALELSAGELIRLLNPGSQQLGLGPDSAELDFVDSTFNWYRLHTRQNYADQEFLWPALMTTPNLSQRDRQPPSGNLVASGVPSFPTFGGAYSAFFHDKWVQSGRNNPSLGQMTLSLVDQRARITRVFAGLTALTVWVEGSSVVGANLELNSSTDRDETTVEKAGPIEFPLPNGLGQDGMVWLKGDSGWLDYRSIAGWGGHRSPDVEIEMPEDPEADISALATQGENTYLEYKGRLPDNTKEKKRTALKDIVAFANGEGGTLLYGVDGDDNAGEVIGLDGDPDTLVRRINDLVRDYVKPSLHVHIKGNDVDGRFVIRVDVDACQGEIRALIVNANSPEYYVRRNGSTYRAQPEELTALVKPNEDPPSPRDFLRNAGY